MKACHGVKLLADNGTHRNYPQFRRLLGRKLTKNGQADSARLGSQIRGAGLPPRVWKVSAERGSKIEPVYRPGSRTVRTRSRNHLAKARVPKRECQRHLALSLSSASPLGELPYAA